MLRQSEGKPHKQYRILSQGFPHGLRHERVIHNTQTPLQWCQTALQQGPDSPVCLMLYRGRLRLITVFSHGI